MTAATAHAALYEAGACSPETFISFSSGARWNLLAPDPRAIVWRDLALRLARMPRFGGGANWSLAEHMLLAARLAPPEARAYALLHDAHEGVLGDWTTPVKAALAELGGAAALAELEHRSAAAIHAAATLDFPPPLAVAVEVVKADLKALATERRDVLDAGSAAGWGYGLPEPAPLRDGRLRARGPEAVAEKFLAALRELTNVDPERAR